MITHHLLLRAITLIMVVIPSVVHAQFTVTTNADNTLTIAQYNGTDGVVIIPDTINGYLVTSVGADAFAYNTNVTSIAVSTNVTSIGGEAFRACANLTNFTIPNGVTNIGGGAFAWCSSLTHITIPSSVTYIDSFAFYLCSSLNELDFQGNAPGFGGANLFTGVDHATVVFPPGTTGWDADYDGVPTWSASYTTNNDTLSIERYAGFGGSVTVPSSIYQLPVTSIGSNAFADNGSLTDITIPSGVTNLGDEAFYACTNLKTILFEGDAPGMGASVFSGSPQAVVFYLPGAVGWGSTFGGLPAWPYYPFAYATNNGAITITGYTGSGGAVTIPSSMFGLPVTRIADYAFQYCYGLTSITIAGSVTNLGTYTFRYDSGLTNVVLPSCITRLNSSVFQGCSLTNIILPDSITYIDALAFSFCPLAHLTIPNSVTYIGSKAFSHTALTNLTIPPSVTGMGSDVFWGCSNLSGAYFLGNAPSVGSLVFQGEAAPTIYYLPGSTGWGATFGGRPAVLWNPQIQLGDGSFGVRSNSFGFNIVGTPDIPIVLEGSTNLTGGQWVPCQTSTLTNGCLYFSDPNWTNFSSRFYRIRSP